MSDDDAPLGYRPVDDSVTNLLRLIGERWTILILRESFLGVRRYGQFAANLGIPRPTLSNRLAKLVDARLLSRERYGEGRVRVDYEYRLTRAGSDLFPALVTLIQWSQGHLADAQTEVDPLRSPLAWTHLSCGAPMAPRLTCDHCGGVVDAGNTRSGPPPATTATTTA